MPRIRRGTRGAEVTWEIPCYKRILAILANPAYAGAFVHGRTCTRTVMRAGRAHKTRGHHRPQDQWEVLIRDHHPAYISWDEHQRIRDQLRTNSGMHGNLQKGAAKRGRALLTGLLRCARCGRKLRVAYGGKGGRVQRYICRSGQLDHGRPWCISFGGLRIDEAISAAVLDAVQPAGVQAALDAWDAFVHQDDEKRKALDLAIQKARYEAQRAQRQYDVVEPENRLVAAESEARWNQSLRTVVELEQRLQSHLAGSEALGDELRVRLLGRQSGGDAAQDRITIRLAVDSDNVPDSKLVVEALDAIPIERPDPTVQEPQHLVLDNGYADAPVDEEVRRRSYVPHVPRRRTNRLSRSICRGRALRWKVERTHCWLNRARRLLVRLEKESGELTRLLTSSIHPRHATNGTGSRIGF